MEVMCINAVAPFTLNARLAPLMKRDDGLDRFIINVSAMEGKFYRSSPVSWLISKKEILHRVCNRLETSPLSFG